MEPEVVTGAFMFCAGGESPLFFDSMPDLNVLCQSMPAGTFSNIVPDINLTPAGICLIRSLESAFPMPCTPIPIGTWITGLPNILINGSPALGMLSMLPCIFGGVISIVFPNNESVLAL